MNLCYRSVLIFLTIIGLTWFDKHLRFSHKFFFFFLLIMIKFISSAYLDIKKKTKIFNLI